MEVSDNSNECLTFSLMYELPATSDVQSILETPATDEIHMKDRNYGLA